MKLDSSPKVISKKKTSGGFLETVKTVVYAVLIALVVRTVAYEPFNIPSGSMVPTLLVGDYLFVSKFSYGYSRYSLPFGLGLFSGRINLPFSHPPQRGDVAVFKLPTDPSTDYIKRIVGLPGDHIQMRHGNLYINEQMVPRPCAVFPWASFTRRAAPPLASEDPAELIGHAFARPELLAEALTHSSALRSLKQGRRRARRAGLPQNYERLEFLGDRVLGLIVADLLWHRFEREPEGPLTHRHAQLVRRDTLAAIASEIGIDRHVQLSPAEAAAGAAREPGILADVLEAVIAAIYLDGGF